ncbi:MAG TPA: hypothetical protein VF883_00325 [Thermoanaerobaculia bacterium]|jgi:hypothetical protein
MAIPLETLQSLASTFTAVRDGPQLVEAGQPVGFRLVPSSGAGLQATDLIDAPVSLTWITKDVRFATSTTETSMSGNPVGLATINSLLTGGMPARVPVPGTIVATENLSGTPGTIAQLAGTFPVAVQVPVHVSVVWQVLERIVVPVGIFPFGPADPASFTALNGTTSPQVAFIFSAPTVELTQPPRISIAEFFIEATVRLTAGTTTVTVTLPPIPVNVPAIPIPTAVVFFLHRNFAPVSGDSEGAAFIIVPNNSPLHSADEFRETLAQLESTLSTLSSIADLALFLLGLRELASALAAQPHVQFRAADSSNGFDDFNDVTLKTHWAGFLFGWTNTEAEDNLSSVIVLGPRRRTVQCFNASDQDADVGRFDLTIGRELYSLVRDLHAKAPVSEPAGTITVVVPPPDLVFVGGTVSRTFGDQLSSLRFA